MTKSQKYHISKGFKNDWWNIKKRNKINTITKNVVDQFIQNIYVYDNKNIEIEFKYKDQYSDAIRFLETKKKCDIIK